jgi:thiaminase
MAQAITIILSSFIIFLLIEEISHLAFRRYLNGPFIFLGNLMRLLSKVKNKKEKAPSKKDFFSQ